MKKFQVVGIGNAMVDVLAPAKDAFVSPLGGLVCPSVFDPQATIDPSSNKAPE